MTNTKFLAPTKLAVEMRIKAELKRNPDFENISTECKQRLVASAQGIHILLSKLEGLPQEQVDAIVLSEEFWTCLSSVAMPHPAEGAATVKFLRNIITDLCA